MYAILQQGGHQFRVAPGDRLLVDRLDAAVGAVVALEPVLLVHDGDAATVGKPVVEGARVAAVVVSHPLGKKLRVYKYKPKKRYRRTHGHRSRYTELRIEALLGAGEALPEPRVVAVKPPVIAAAPAAGSRRPARSAAGRTTHAAAPVVELEVEETDAAVAVADPDVALGDAEVAETPTEPEAAAPPRRTRKPKPAADEPAASEE